MNSLSEYVMSNVFVPKKVCISGHYSWRNTTNGSWFIQSLVHVLSKEAAHEDLLSMMTSVNRHMVLNFESNTPCEYNINSCSRVTHSRMIGKWVVERVSENGKYQVMKCMLATLLSIYNFLWALSFLTFQGCGSLGKIRHF